MRQKSSDLFKSLLFCYSVGERLSTSGEALLERAVKDLFTFF